MIRTIIFDFGGVVIDIDYVRPIKKYKKYGINDFETRFSKATQDGFFQKMELGRVSNDAFIAEIRSISGKNLTHLEIISAWNSIIVGYQKKRIELLSKVKKNYSTILLSNTNALHIEEAMKLYNQDFQKPFSDLFHKIYWSYEIGMRKPDRKIFEFVLKQNHTFAYEALFIDDSIQHIEAAQTLGIKTLHLKDEMDMLDLFEENGKLKQLDTKNTNL